MNKIKKIARKILGFFMWALCPLMLVEWHSYFKHYCCDYEFGEVDKLYWDYVRELIRS